MKCDKDLCLNFWYDFKKLLWKDELNPRVRCAFGDVLIWSIDHKEVLILISQASMSIKVDRNASQLERMTLVKPKIEIKATLRNASSTVFEQGYEETCISNLAMSVFILQQLVWTTSNYWAQSRW